MNWQLPFSSSGFFFAAHFRCLHCLWLGQSVSLSVWNDVSKQGSFICRVSPTPRTCFACSLQALRMWPGCRSLVQYFYWGFITGYLLLTVMMLGFRPTKSDLWALLMSYDFSVGCLHARFFLFLELWDRSFANVKSWFMSGFGCGPIGLRV